MTSHASVAASVAPVPCRHCLYVPHSPGANWGYHEGAQGDWASCAHITGQRECRSCSRSWWREGNDSGWDVDGAEREDCPECVAANAADAAETQRRLALWDQIAAELKGAASAAGRVG